jgi:ribonuclease HI
MLYTDAGTWDNGTKRQRSVLAVWDSRTQAVVVDEDLPGTTNNEAEYAAIIAALELARGDRLRGVLIRSDSQLCVNQINGTWQIKEERLRPLRERAARLLKGIGGRIEWVPRERNYAGIYLEKRPKR